MNKSKLFNASCIALIVTAMTFAIRAGILNQLGTDFELSDGQLGFVNSMAFLGFPAATIFGGLLFNWFGAKRLMYIAFVCHLLGLFMTIFAMGFWTLLISTFLIGFANGSVEAACNPLIADLYPKDKTTMLNKFHVWFPGGIVIGALISTLMSSLDLGWQLQITVMIIPTFIYGYLVFSNHFPKTENLISSTSTNLRNMLSPLFILVATCMTLTATTELGTQQWIEKILGSSGAHPMLILAMVTGIMALGRYFAGPVIHKLNPVGVLLGSAVISTIALVLMSMATGPMVYFAAILFAIGVCYFWPTMIGYTAEYLPQTGALGMSIIGGIGMMATSMWQPVIGNWLDSERAKAIASGMTKEAADLIAGQATLDNLAIFPAILIALFGVLYFITKSKLKIQHETS